MKRILGITLLLTVLFSFSTLVSAQLTYLDSGCFMCPTYDNAVVFAAAAKNNDKEGMKAMLKSGKCELMEYVGVVRVNVIGHTENMVRLQLYGTDYVFWTYEGYLRK